MTTKTRDAGNNMRTKQAKTSANNSYEDRLKQAIHVDLKADLSVYFILLVRKPPRSWQTAVHGPRCSINATMLTACTKGSYQ